MRQNRSRSRQSHDRGINAPLILLDATAVPADRGGVGRYVDGLVAVFEGDLVIACQQRDLDFYRRLAPSAIVLPQHPRIASIPLRLLWEQFVLPRVARRSGASIIHSPHYTVPLFTRRTRAVTFHDATFFSNPELHTRLKRVFFTTWIRLSTRLADAVIVPSRATANELGKFVNTRLVFDVIYHGVDKTIFFPPTTAEVQEAAGRLGLSGKRWIAFLGTIEPRKNVPALVHAYRDLVARWSPSWGPVPTLALAGGRGWETGLEAETSQVAAPGEIVMLGFVALNDLRSLLGGADVVCYPSLGEGFGLPVLEAMSCGTAVLTTRNLALPEVGGAAVAYSEVDPASISRELESLLTNDNDRAALAALGLERAKNFTWHASALAHEAVFTRLVQKARSS